MIDLLDIRYVRLGTRDLDAADRFAREVVGLELARAEAGARYYRSDDRDHTLVYFEGDPLIPHDSIIATIPDPAARERLVARLDLAAAVPLHTLAYRWDIVLTGAHRTPLEAEDD